MSDITASQSAPTRAESAGLKRELKLPSILMQSIGMIAPAAGLLLTIQFLAGFAGIATPVSILVGLAIMVMVAVSLSDLARRLPSAGGYYTFLRMAVGPRAGFIAACVSLVWIMAAAMNTAFLSYIVSNELESSFAVDIPWPILFVAIILVTGYLAWYGISYSGKALLVLGSIELVVLLVLGAWGLLDPGPGGVSLDAFNPGSAPSVNGLYLGVVFSVFLFAGWEGAAPIAEESQNPRWAIPRALVGSLLIVGGVLAFVGWGIMSGWGIDRLEAFQNAAELPPLTVAEDFWGDGYLILLLALMNSVIAICLGSMLFATRVIYAMSRAGVLPAWFAQLSPRHNTPARATGAHVVFSLALGGIFAGLAGPDDAFFIYGLAFTLLVITMYIAGNVGVYSYFRHREPDAFRPVVHAILPLLTTLALIWVGYKSISPLPDYPVRAGIWLAAGWFVVSVLGALFLGSRADTRGAVLAGDVPTIGTAVDGEALGEARP
jgi:amino acid transporter